MTETVPGLVSTIIPVFNRASMLKEAVQSVLDQAYRPIEIIIVDDGSTDETGKAADDLALTYPELVRVVHQNNSGPGLAREAGRQLACGEFIQYLDSDDLLMPEKFERQVSGLRIHSDCGVSYGWTRYRHPDGRIEPEPWKGSGRQTDAIFPSFLESRWWDTVTPLYRSSICAKAGAWSTLRLDEDWEFDCRVAALGVRLHYVPAYVAEVRAHHEGRLSGNPLSSERLQERARAHALILQHAFRAGITDECSEMRVFSRTLFLLSRQCGASGLVKESEFLFNLAKQASGKNRAAKMDFILYGAFASWIGWKVAGRIACFSDQFRHLRGSSR